MKNLLYLSLAFIIACSNPEEATVTERPSKYETPIVQTIDGQNKQEIVWNGTLNAKIPILVHYAVKDSLVVGEILYLNTKDKTPIKLIGRINEDKSFRLNEFDPTGNITGILVGVPTSKEFNGTWYSPKTEKELSLNLTRKDTLMPMTVIDAVPSAVFGNYHYQYAEDGYQGDFELIDLKNGKVAFNVFSVTRDPARNIAEVPLDTIELTGNSFIYKYPEYEDCEFKVSLYKDFVEIHYTHGYCEGVFGHNATVDGVFLKTK